MLRLVLDSFIFLSRHLPLTFLLCGLAAWCVGGGRLATWGRSPTLRRAAMGGSLLLIAAFAGVGAWYLTADGFAGEVEPVVSCLSWLVRNGHPLYTDFDAAERYSVLYGPSVFLTNGLFLRLLGPSLAAAKLASLLGNLGGLAFLYAALARRRRDQTALVAVGLAVLYFWIQGFAVYLVRPDALLVFAVGFGLYAATRVRRPLAVAALAAAAGFAVNLKAHGAVYMLPAFVLLDARCGRRATVRALLLTGVCVALPFLWSPQVSVVNYVGWLVNAASHGLEWPTLALTFGFAALLLLPVGGLLAAAPDRPSLVAAHRAELWALLPVFGLTLLLAAKPGAGPVHLLPLVPSTLHLLVGLWRGMGPPDWVAVPRLRLRRTVVAATCGAALLAGSVNAYRSVRFVAFHIGETADVVAEVRGIMADYPGRHLSMACGGENLAFRATWLRPLLVFADNPMLIDPISVMDTSLSGRGLSSETYRAIAEGEVAIWLVPRSQQPFAKVNWYAPHEELFPVEFRAHFKRWYTPLGHTRNFDLWFWKGLPELGSKRLVDAGTGGGGDGASGWLTATAARQP